MVPEQSRHGTWAIMQDVIMKGHGAIAGARTIRSHGAKAYANSLTGALHAGCVEFSAGIVLYRDTDAGRRFLLLRYPSGHWDFAKGHLEDGESDREAAIRELDEETGITDAVFVDGFKRRIRYRYGYHGQSRSKQVTFFLASTKTRTVLLSEEHQGYMWCSYRESLRQVTFRNARSVLGHANRFLKSSKKRAGGQGRIT